MKTFVLTLATCVAMSTLSAASGRPISIPDRAKGGHSVVVATVLEVTPTFERNSFGDQLIVSHAFLRVEESLKGQAADVIPLDVEGGTIGNLTLHVSDVEPIRKGEQAVFFIQRTPSGANVPHLRGNGVLKLDATNHVRDSVLSLDELKRQVGEGLRIKSR
jgi:hypothetical protein